VRFEPVLADSLVGWCTRKRLSLLLWCCPETNTWSAWFARRLASGASRRRRVCWPWMWCRWSERVLPWTWARIYLCVLFPKRTRPRL